MTWVIFIFSLEIGLIPNGVFLMYDRQPIEFENGGELYPSTVDVLDFSYSIYTDFQFEAEILNYLFIGGGVRIVMLPTNDYSFDPHSSYYNFTFGGRLGPFEVFWHHYCLHPIMTYMFDYIPLDGWEGSYDEIGFKISSKIPLRWKR